jgi:hypothetical protein
MVLRPYDSMKGEREKMRNLWRADATLTERIIEAWLPIVPSLLRLHPSDAIVLRVLVGSQESN